MRALATRPRRLALAIAMISAATLGTVSASATSASGTSTTKAATEAGASVASPLTGAPKGAPKEAPKGVGFGVLYKPTTGAPDDVNEANTAFAACMREQGQKYFPDFHASKDAKGHVGLRVKLIGKKGFDPASDAFQKALDECAPILKKVGITFPAASDLPPLPKPGKGPRSGKSLHSEPGKPGKSGGFDLPSLTSVIENA
jgi:hypothetical protein